jgi:putative CocE/NonD family hydrolase
VRCTLSDGVVLVSDHYYPSEELYGAGGWPTLLMRQPYGRDIASTVVYAHPVWFARHGYHVVIQDVRGRGESEGEFYPFRYEGRDGAETIAWLRSIRRAMGVSGCMGSRIRDRRSCWRRLRIQRAWFALRRI